MSLHYNAIPTVKTCFAVKAVMITFRWVLVKVQWRRIGSCWASHHVHRSIVKVSVQGIWLVTPFSWVKISVLWLLFISLTGIIWFATKFCLTDWFTVIFRQVLPSFWILPYSDPHLLHSFNWVVFTLGLFSIITQNYAN